MDKHYWSQLLTLLKLVEIGAQKRSVKISTKCLAEKMIVSQQTASRYLIELNKKGWIERTMTAEGGTIKITELGSKEIEKLYVKLCSLTETEEEVSIVLEGVVCTGLGEGAYYISLEPYRKQFKEKLGFDPYFGTLNIKLVTDYDVKSHSELEVHPSIHVEGFKNENRSFGSVKCYPVIIENKVKGALVSALRGHYDNSIVEIIAPLNLRKVLNLKDGKKIKLEILKLT